MKIVVLPGIGDIHWCILKVESFAKLKGEKDIDIIIWSPSRPRAIEYVNRLPFVNSAKYLLRPAYQFGNIWQKLTQEAGNDIITSPFKAFDYFMGFNATLEQGKNIADIRPELEINWKYPIIETEEDRHYGDSFLEYYGHFTILYFPQHGHYKNWNFDFDKIVKSIPTDSDLILTGAAWDVSPKSDLINISGKTTLGQLLSLIRRAKRFVGYAAGNGILANHLGIPTALLWDKPYKPGFDKCWVNKEHDYLSLWPGDNYDLLRGI